MLIDVLSIKRLCEKLSGKAPNGVDGRGRHVESSDHARNIDATATWLDFFLGTSKFMRRHDLSDGSRNVECGVHGEGDNLGHDYCDSCALTIKLSLNTPTLYSKKKIKGISNAETLFWREVMRSLLFVPADSPRKLEKSLQSGSDVLIFDLEDAVSPSRKQEGRTELVKFLTDIRQTGLETPQLYVRVNALTTGMTLADLAAVMPCRPAGIVLPKSTGAKDLALLSAYLEAFEHLYPQVDTAQGGTRSSALTSSALTSIIAIVTETADSLAGLNEYRGATPRLAGMMWGAEDLSGDIGALTNKEEGASGEWSSPFKLVRSLCLFAATAAGVPAIDTVPTEINNVEALTRETRQAYRDGFSAKAAIHPGQVPVINQAMTPDAATQEWASRVIAAFAASASVGVATLDGKMLDTPHLRLAKKVIAAAKLA